MQVRMEPAVRAGLFDHCEINLDLERGCKRHFHVRNLCFIEKQSRSATEWE